MSSDLSFPIYVIGDTPLAYFLVAKLSIEGEDVRLLSENKSLHTLDSFTLKDETLSQKRTVRIKLQTIMHDNAQMILLCMSPEKIKSGLIYFSKAKAEKCPVLSFCQTLKTDLLTKVIGQPIIPAYFDGWLKTNTDNSLIYYGTQKGLTVGISSHHSHYDIIQETLDKTDIPTVFSANQKQNFWNYFIPEATCSFFSLQNGNHLRDIAKKTAFRQNLNTILDELLTIVPENTEINKEQIISSIYSTPSNYKYPISEGTILHQKAVLSYLSDVIRSQSAYKVSNLPVINALITQHQMLQSSSVEE
ncbi:MAG: hypothetical protein IJ529_05745 [Alphaproteobacteria bacterium]|nr:hypothetical protein [Alphaproteobacteria bacterium]MBQ8677952.1 hypothetical protein [Alphaproteobacteria bacterium]